MKHCNFFFFIAYKTFKKKKIKGAYSSMLEKKGGKYLLYPRTCVKCALG